MALLYVSFKPASDEDSLTFITAEQIYYRLPIGKCLVSSECDNVEDRDILKYVERTLVFPERQKEKKILN